MEDLSFYNRLMELINSLGISQNKFEGEVGWTKGTIKNISHGGSPGLDNIQKIFGRYPDINTDWLILGKEKKQIPDIDNLIMAESPTRYGSPMPLVVTVDNSGKETVLMVGSKAFAGYTSSSQEPEYIRQLPSFGLGIPEFRHGTYRAFQVSGSSMEGTLMNGDWVIGQYVDNWANNIQDGRVYIVVTTETILVKRILNRLSDGKLIIISDNPAYATDYVHPEDVRELWYAKAKFGFQFPNTRYDVIEEILNLKADLAIIQQKLGLALSARKGSA